MLIVDKISMALSVIDWPTYDKWLDAHEYTKSKDTVSHYLRCKATCNALLKVFTEQELRDLFTLTHDNDL